MPRQRAPWRTTWRRPFVRLAHERNSNSRVGTRTAAENRKAPACAASTLVQAPEPPFDRWWLRPPEAKRSTAPSSCRSSAAYCFAVASVYAVTIYVVTLRSRASKIFLQDALIGSSTHGRSSGCGLGLGGIDAYAEHTSTKHRLYENVIQYRTRSPPNVSIKPVPI